MKKIILIITMALFIVCAESNPRDQCEQHRMRNSTDYTADGCAMQFLIFNSFSLPQNPTPDQLESARKYREQVNLFVGNICLQSSLAAARCRKIKPGFSNR